MKSNTAIKIKISILLSIISLIYFFCFNLLLYRDLIIPYLIPYHLFLGFMSYVMPFFGLLGPPIPLVFYSFISVFVYPYIKINSQSILKRGLFFGAIIWILNMFQFLDNLRHALAKSDIVSLSEAINAPLYFIILGLAISFCYKKFLLTEFNLSLKKLEVPLVKVIAVTILTSLIYILFLYFPPALLLVLISPRLQIDIWNDIIIHFLNPLLYVVPLIYGLIFTVLYITTIRRIDIQKTKKWILFGLFVSFFTVPLFRPPTAIGFPDAIGPLFAVLLFVLPIFHLLAIFRIAHTFTRLLDDKKPLSKNPCPK